VVAHALAERAEDLSNMYAVINVNVLGPEA
jgi:hypothetical protein